MAQETVYSGWLDDQQISVSVDGKVAHGFLGTHQINWRVKKGIIVGLYDDEPFHLYIEPDQIAGKIGELQIRWYAENRSMDRYLGVAE